MPVTVCWAQPVAWVPAVTDTVRMLWPDGVGTTAWKLPSEPATVWTITVVLAEVPGWPTAMVTAAPGAVFPVTVAWVCWVIRPASWLARMSSVIPGAAVDVEGGVATAPGAVTLMVSQARAIAARSAATMVLVARPRIKASAAVRARKTIA